MVCSEKELGISEEHEGVIFLDDDAPVGTPLADYMGDAVLGNQDQPQHGAQPQRLGHRPRGGGADPPAAEKARIAS